MSFAIFGMGTALPPTRLSKADAERVARAMCCSTPEHAELVAALYRQAGIDSRHILFDEPVVRDVLDGTRHTGSPYLPAGADNPGPPTSVRMKTYEDHALPLARQAAAAALADAGLDPATVTHLVTVSCTGFAAPGVDVGLIKRLGLRPTTERTHVGFMGCHGALNGLRVARGYADADPAARVLVCAVELCSLHYHYGWNPKRMVANALFADGAAAVVGGQSDGGEHWRVAATGSCLFPDSEYAMTWSVGDHGFDMTLSTRVPNLIAANLRPWAERWLRQQGLAVADIKSWAVHPGGPRVLTDVEAALGLAPDMTAVSREVLGECGNMSSPTVLFLLDRLRRRGAPLPCAALGFGPGLVVEAALIR
ncbi:MAG TPA: type III polyketide synthase [Gemmataceae bacterium]|jgi:predicted naringenin-chalcone synthase